ncbi:MAG: arylsulfatase [Gammaproteobacteria bacterium]|nr:arylsulfatase [Gammaproteobacteria bacterium]
MVSILALLVACTEETKAPKAPEQAEKTAPVAQTAAASPQKPNILFILTDDLGFHQVGAYGQSQISTPTIDSLAADGIKFTQAYAGSTVCSPSRVSLFLGRDGRALHDNSNMIKLRKQDVTFAHVLKAAGYNTALFGKYSLGSDKDPANTTPLKMGFDHWYGMNDILEGHRQYPTFLWENDQKFTVDANLEGNKGAYAQKKFTEETIKFIQQERDAPFFAFLAYSSPHAELAAPKEFVDQYSGKFSERAYTGMATGKPADKYATYYPEPVAEPNATMAAMITALDTYIGEIMQTLEEQGLADNTIIIFSSDNGPHDEGGADPKFFEASKPYKGMKRDLYDGGIHVPMIVRWPAAIKKPRVDHTPWAFADVLPTFAELAGVSLADVPGANTNGLSIAPILNDSPEPMPERILYWEFGKQVGDPNSGVIGEIIQAARQGDWKAVRYDLDKPVELYNIIKDPGESNNLADDKPEMTEAFYQLFEKYKASDS